MKGKHEKKNDRFPCHKIKQDRRCHGSGKFCPGVAFNQLNLTIIVCVGLNKMK